MNWKHVLVVFLLLVVLAGCSSDAETEVASPENETESETTTLRANEDTTSTISDTTSTMDTTVAKTGTSTEPDTTSERSDEGVTIVETTDPDSDGRYSSFALEIQTDTRLPDADGEGEAGEPFYRVRIDGEQVTETDEVERSPQTTTIIQIDSSMLRQFDAGELNVSVVLLDEDVAFDDEVRTWSLKVPYGPSPSATEQPTDTPTGTETPDLTPETQPSTTTATTERSRETPTPLPEPSTETRRGPNQGTKWTVTITRVIDGDTVEARFPNGETDTLRLLGVDTPETTLSRVSPDEFEGIPDTTGGRDHLFNWGEKAESYTRNELSGETVQIEVDSEADRRGSFGRLLVYIYTDGENFNKQLLSEGYARMYESSFSKRTAFEAAESTAQETSTGLWDYTATQTPSPTATATETPSDSGDDEDIPPLPDDGDYDCGHFDMQDQAQAVLERESGDPHRLDRDSDGIACESLP